ncbi:MAG: AAC(3) family N-acetyltransferase [Armatimonadetes bacterium]|nr:AAC(3) family N-acetyltransferase [Armatimonadota bacterium]
MSEGDRGLTRDEIIADLRALGIEPGDRLIVHSSLRSLGWVEGAAHTVVEALLAAVFPGGTVAVPTHTRPMPVMDLRTAACHTGAIPNALRIRPDAVRSPDPTHSVAAVGPDAAWVCAGHPRATALGVDSPFDRLARMGAKILLLGVTHTTNSTIHVAEARYGVPYLDKPYSEEYEKATIRVIGPGGVDFTVRGIRECPGCSRNFDVLDEPMTDSGRQIIGRVGAAECRLMSAEDLIACAHEALDADIGALLCDDPACPACPIARTTLSG